MKVLWLRHAEEALYRTEAYILKEYGLSASDRFIKEVRDVAYLLEKMPELGHFEPLLSHYEQGYRSIVINKLNKLIYSTFGSLLEQRIRLIKRIIHGLWISRIIPNFTNYRAKPLRDVSNGIQNKMTLDTCVACRELVEFDIN